MQDMRKESERTLSLHWLVKTKEKPIAPADIIIILFVIVILIGYTTYLTAQNKDLTKRFEACKEHSDFQEHRYKVFMMPKEETRRYKNAW